MHATASASLLHRLVKHVCRRERKMHSVYTVGLHLLFVYPVNLYSIVVHGSSQEYKEKREWDDDEKSGSGTFATLRKPWWIYKRKPTHRHRWCETLNGPLSRERDTDKYLLGIFLFSLLMCVRQCERACTMWNLHCFRFRRIKRQWI